MYLLKLQLDWWCKMGRHPLSGFPPNIHGFLYSCNSKLDHDRVRVPINYLHRLKKNKKLLKLLRETIVRRVFGKLEIIKIGNGKMNVCRVHSSPWHPLDNHWKGCT